MELTRSIKQILPYIYINLNLQKHEDLAEIHSSFEEVVSSSNGDSVQSSEAAAAYIVAPEQLSVISAE